MSELSVLRRILITGSRDWTDAKTIQTAINTQLRKFGTAIIVHGACRGADTLAGEFAARNPWCREERHPAMWENEKSAGPIRNQEMVDLGADVCLAFPLPQSRGTYDCMRRAEAAGIPVKVFNSVDA